MDLRLQTENPFGECVIVHRCYIDCLEHWTNIGQREREKKHKQTGENCWAIKWKQMIPTAEQWPTHGELYYKKTHRSDVCENIFDRFVCMCVDCPAPFPRSFAHFNSRKIVDTIIYRNRCGCVWEAKWKPHRRTARHVSRLNIFVWFEPFRCKMVAPVGSNQVLLVIRLKETSCLTSATAESI